MLVYSLKKLDTKFLLLRSGSWYFLRKNPIDLLELLDHKKFARFSLKTPELHIAKKKRDKFLIEQNRYWAILRSEGKFSDKSIAYYEQILKTAKHLNLEYVLAEDLVQQDKLDDILSRLNIIEKGDHYKSNTITETALGLAKQPNPKLSEVLDVYLEKLIIPKLGRKSHRQKQHVINPKKRVMRYFIDLVGNKKVFDINRSDANTFLDWLQDRILSDGKDKLTANSANRYITEIRGILKDYYAHQGKEDIPDPFRRMKFKDKFKKKRTPFSTEYIQELLNTPDKLKSLDIAARLVIYAMINTGARSSEICNILPENIHIEGPVPYISFVEQNIRELKTVSSSRVIPIFGVSLMAFKKIKKGALKKYHDDSDAFSASAMSYFRRNKLLPAAKDNQIFTMTSFRHSYKKRLTEAGVDVEIRDVSMGHKIDKPDYGDYGSIEYRMKLLKRIDLPFNPKIFD